MRERTNKVKLLKDSYNAITGIAFRSSSKLVYLFVATSSSVYLYNITVKDKEQKVEFCNFMFLVSLYIITYLFILKT